MSSRKMNPRFGDDVNEISKQPSINVIGGITPSPSSRPLHATSSQAQEYESRSSGKRTLTAEEADEYERYTRKRRPVESTAPIGSKLMSDAMKSESIVISDDEEEESPIPPSSQQPESPSNIPAPKSVGNEEEPNAEESESIPLFLSIATIAPGQESAFPDSESVQGLIRRLENAMKQAMSIISTGWGTFADFDSFIADSLKEIQRIGGAYVAKRCEQKLLYLEAVAHRLEGLVFSDMSNEVERLVAQARVKRMHEREAWEKSVSEGEFFLTHLLSRQHQLQAEMEISSAAIVRLKALLAEEESNLKGFQLANANVHQAIKTAVDSLHTLHREEETVAASFELKIRKEIEVQVRANRAEVLADIKAELASFNLLD